MQRTLSSAQTFFMKFIFPAIWVAIVGFATGVLYMSGEVLHTRSGTPLPPQSRFLFVAVWLLGGAFIFWTCARLKRVRIDAEALYISNYSKEVRVPLHDITTVTENRWISIHPVTVEFQFETEFGRSILFMPKARPFGFWSAHPVVAELQEAARRAAGYGTNFTAV